MSNNETNFDLNFFRNIKADGSAAEVIEIIEANLGAADEWEGDYDSYEDALESFQQNALDTLMEKSIDYDVQDFCSLWKGAQA